MSTSPWRALGGKCRALLCAAKSSAAAAPKAAKRAAPSTAASGVDRKPAGLLKSVRVSPTLGEFLGAQEASRTEAIKKVWDHIKANGLQNPSNKKEIICDEKLKTLLGKERVGFLEIARLISPHFVKSG